MGVGRKPNEVPLYLQLKNEVVKQIRTGVLKSGDQLPSEAQYQKKYKMSRVTVRNAMEELARDGYINKVQGKGSFVSYSDLIRLPVGVTSFYEDAKMQGVQLTSEVIKFDIEDISSELDKEFLETESNNKVLVLLRARKVNGVPVSLEENHLPVELSGLMQEDLSGSLYEILNEKYHIIPTQKGRRSIKITFANEFVSKNLQLSLGTPVIETEMCVFDMAGEPIHTVREWVRGDINLYFKWLI